MDSGDDEGRYDQHGSPMDEDGMDYTESVNVMDLSLSRVPEPESTDGEVLHFFVLYIFSVRCYAETSYRRSTR